MRTNFLIASLLLLSAVPAQAADNAIVIRNARIVTVSGPVIEGGSVVIRDGKISAVGKAVRVPGGSTVIDAAGSSVYPGLFDADSQLGMGAASEKTMGDFTPQLQVYASFHFEDGPSAGMAVASGVTQLMVRPYHREYAAGLYRPGLLPGQASIMNLRGGMPDQMAIRKGAGVVLNFPTVGSLDYSEDERFKITPWSELKSAMDANLGQVRSYFADARSYMNRKESLDREARARMPVDPGLEAMIPLLKRQKPLLIDAANYVDIRNAIEFAGEQDLDFVLLGAEEAWRVLDLLKESNARLIVTGTYKVPAAEDHPVNVLHRLPAMLHERGIPFAISSQGSYDTRLLPYQAGTAVAYGLPHDAALRSITLSPAEILGVDDELGSIDPGKRANLVVTDGDILEISTRIQHVLIDGRVIDLETDDDRLYPYYLERN